MLENKQVMVIACDIRENNGEGRLAALYVKNIENCLNEELGNSNSLNVSIKVITPSIRLNSRFLNSIMCYSWMYYQLIIYRITKKKVFIINYLPLWNVLFFLFVPRSAVLGPITGGGKINLRHFGGSGFGKLKVNITRNKLLPLLNYISSRIIHWRSLSVKPATLSVARALNLSEDCPRAIWIDHLPFEQQKATNQNTQKTIDVLSYVGDHSIKNTSVTVALLNRLATIGLNVVLVGRISKGSVLNEKLVYYPTLPHDEMIGLISRSSAIISLSLEEAGFFTFEAAAFGCNVLCLPQTGGAQLPGSRILLQGSESIDVDLLFQRVERIIKEMKNCPQKNSEEISRLLEGMHHNATSFFYKS